MLIQSIKMPDIGEGIAEVEVVAWRVAVGDEVAEDQILADVMTDKATVEIPSHVAGIVLSLDAAVGQVVAVGTPIIHIKTAAALIEQAQVAMLNEAPDSAEAPSALRPVSVPSAAATTLAASPAAAPPATPEAAPHATPTTIATPVDAAARSSAPAAPNTVPEPAPDDRPIAAPAVRRRAWELGIDLSQIAGTGPAGRITHGDLDQAAAHGNAGAPAMGDTRYARLTREETLPVIGLRRKIAQKMQEAKRRIPHFTYVEEIDVTELEALRARLNTEFGKTRGRLTLLPFLIRALVLAVREHPEVNARYDDDAAIITRYAAVHLGMATQTDGGLMVPVIRHAETLDVWACAAEISRLAEVARSGRATREELSGSTITLTSLGPLSGISHTPVINHPEVAIVGPNRIVERPMMLGGQVVARKMMNVSSSFDHRVVDGMNAAEFIQRLRGYLESPATLFIS
ncbi:dihydrolipoamide acetyltransferase family protein [Rhodoferax antarcticus]|uniref:dihydrolipoamide acetyltransferase family protein n=1 Tax=Rhodoferax antarcticus TaxID=81479 RepID=UPI00222428A4|nr:dihydrolipoamide acetyltransferase family protein [Rhodoferax antarcticus]MCW2310559.1 2-oxoisovalerate dehydrogenase E2 component (dihydrolipoyl transacylase) [Rhodoferax antarcticus]